MSGWSGNRVLILSDDPVAVNLLSGILDRSGFTPEVLTSLDNTTSLLKKKTYALVVLDSSLESLNQERCSKICHEIKAADVEVKILLLVDSSNTVSSNAVSDVDMRLEKPLVEKNLAMVIQSLLPAQSGLIDAISIHLSKRVHRSMIKLMQICLDATILLLAFWLSYMLRFEFELPEMLICNALRQTPIVLIIQFVAIVFFGIYSLVWRYIGFRELKKFIFAAAGSFLPLLLMRIFFSSKLQLFRLPISIAVMTTAFGFGGLILIRLVRRSVYEKYQKRRILNENIRLSGNPLANQSMNREKKRVLLIGAGQAGVHAADEILKRGELDIKIIGFIDDDISKSGLVISGVRVIGTTDNLGEIVREQKIDHVIITIAHATRQTIARIVRICESIPVKMRIVPGLYELLDGKVEVSRIRDVEIEDLLGREKVELELETMRKFLTGRRVMITGAGGSIGSELVRQVTRFTPGTILMIERSEYALYQIQMEVCRQTHHQCLPLIADIGDEERMQSIFEKYRPEVIFHAAAHKHVPLMELNPTEAIKNNTLATWKLASMAGRCGTEVFVLISTDKAVNPTSIMGASKRVAELLIQGLNGIYDTRYLAVRFGNVLGSSGSVIPAFKEQIRKGGPVTVTHPEMTRYFMTIPEAAQLVMQAGTMGCGAEIFILDMGEPVRIVDLAETMIRLSGFKPHEDIIITYTGLRPGEKLFEELNTGEDHVDRTRHPKIFIGKIKEFESGKVKHVVDNLIRLSNDGHENELRRYLADLLPESRLTLKEP